MKSHILLIGYPKDGSEPRLKIITGPAEPQFRAAGESGKYRSVALVSGHEYQAWEAQG